MGYFAERTRIKIDEQGLVRLSVRADESCVDEYVFSYSEFEAVREAYEYEMDIRSSNIRVKRIPNGYSVQLKEGVFKRKIYDFTVPEFSMLMAQYGSKQLMFEKEGGMSQVGTIDPVDDLKTLSVKLEHSFERLYEEVKNAGARKGVDFDLEGILRSIDSKLNAILENTQNIKITGAINNDTTNTVSTSFYDEEDELFIPSSFEGETFTGKVNRTSEVSEGSTDSAAEALRKLRQRGKK
jgi:small nuclear ribonucleoprotein (snRNP)-like protein